MLVLALLIAKPFPQLLHFSLPLVSQKNQNQHCVNKPTSSYNHQFNCLLTWNISNRVGRCLYANSTKKTE